MANSTTVTAPINVTSHGIEPIDRVLERLRACDYDPRDRGPDQWESRCPAHKGNRRNLSISVGDDGAVLLKCHHEPNCSAAAIVAELGLELRDLFRAKFSANPKRKPVAKGKKSQGTGWKTLRDAVM